MEIRHATDADIPGIVELLKLSLGQSLMPKSEAYWRWKHIDNPFGRSPVLVAEDNGSIIGVRAFMRWDWRLGGKKFHSIRAVDTATHPDHQGKGIFKKLTLALVDLCRKDGVDFIFNTPNAQSKPGYLKMGWVEAGNLPISVKISRPFNLARNAVLTPAPYVTPKYNMHKQIDGEAVQSFVERCASQSGDLITTDISARYLVWRYRYVPVVQYTALIDNDNEKILGLLMARAKDGKYGRELRITDLFLSNESDGRSLMSQLGELEKSWQTDYTTVSGAVGSYAIGIMRKYSVYYKLNRGPSVTIRDLNFGDLGTLSNFKNWSPTLGDLELF